jgi:hypothetical protein
VDADDDLYENLPEDKELAFLILEENLRRQLYSRLQTGGNNQSVVNSAYLEYINKTIASGKALAIHEFTNMNVPNLQAAQNFYSSFETLVENLITQVRIRHGRRSRGYSIQLDSVTKEKIHHYLAAIRNIVEKLEVKIEKKEALYRCILALESEVDRDRTRMDAYGALAIEIANTGGKAARTLKPAWGLLGTIGKVLGIARDAETGGAPLQLEPPRAQLPPPDAEGASD